MRYFALALVAGIGFSMPAVAADLAGGAPYGTLNRSVLEPSLGLRGSIGLRYWFSQADVSTSGGTVSQVDSDGVDSHSAEFVFKIQDESSNSFLRTYLGIGANVSGDQTLAGVNASGFDNSRFGYATLDAGWQFLDFAGGAITTEAFIGYQYLGDTFDANYAGVSFSQDMDWHSVRLGVGAQGEITDRINWAVEAAAIPWAYNTTESSSSTYAYGAQADLFVDYEVNENFEVGVGGRYWYLHSDLGSTPSAEVEYKRYGLLLEGKYNF